MKICRPYIVCIALALLAVPKETHANYQAFSVSLQLLDKNNVGVNGIFDIKLSLHNAAVGGKTIWSEMQTGVVVNDGIMHAILGNKSNNPMPKSYFYTQNIWVAVEVTGGPDVSGSGSGQFTRQPLRGVSYAYKSLRADSVTKVPSNNSDPSCTGSKRGYVHYNTGNGQLKYCTGSQWRTVTSVPSCSSGQVPKWTGSKFECKTDKDTKYSGKSSTGVVLDGKTFKMGAISTQLIANGTIENKDLKNNTIEGTKIVDGSITGNLISNGTLTNADVSNSANIPISMIKGAAKALHAHDSDYVNEGQSNSVTSSMIKNNTLANSDLKNSTLNGDKIATGGVGSADIDANQIQKRNTSTCASGKWIKGINVSGNVICESDGQGPVGAKGVKGGKGPVGSTGPKGDTGDTGNKGSKGSEGPTGPKGAKGDIGNLITGPKGPKGSAGGGGSKGAKGDTGDKGPAGAKGPKGDAGESGVQCSQGWTATTHSCSDGSTWGATANCPSNWTPQSGGWTSSNWDIYQWRSYRSGSGWRIDFLCKDHSPSNGFNSASADVMVRCCN